MWGSDEMCTILGINLFMISEKNVLKVPFQNMQQWKKANTFCSRSKSRNLQSLHPCDERSTTFSLTGSLFSRKSYFRIFSYSKINS